MNAVLAKPIHAIWFIQARAVDLGQSLAAALFVGLPSWLRDHPPLPRLSENCCVAQSKILARGALSDPRKRPPERRIGVAGRGGIVEIGQHGLSQRLGAAELGIGLQAIKGRNREPRGGLPN